MRKEDADKIRKLIAEGLTNVEIRERTGASESYISKLKKETNLGGESSSSIIQLSEKSQRYLLLMQTAMGLKDTNAAVESIYNDFLLINNKKIRFDPNNEKSISEVFIQLLKELDRKINIDDIVSRIINDEEFSNNLLDRLGVDEVTVFFYYFELGDLTDEYIGTIFNFMNNKVKENYLKDGWIFQEYYNQKLKKNHTLIIDPSGNETYLPIE